MASPYGNLYMRILHPEWGVIASFALYETYIRR